MTPHIFIAFLILICIGNAQAQQFIRNEYVEVGIHSAGSFGSEVNCPMGYHQNASTLGFVCDFQRDGWDNGIPNFMGDYFVPGTPEEGWTIEWDANGNEKYFHNYGLRNLFDIPRLSDSKITATGYEKAIWTGEAESGNEKLMITQQTTLRSGDLYFTIDVLLQNSGTETLYSVEYMRNLDPDNEVMITTSYTTSNFVRYQPGPSSDSAIVVAKGLIFQVPVILGAIDPRARVSVGGFSNRDPDFILDFPNSPSESSPSVWDEAITIAFRFDSLAPGECIAFTYFYGLEEMSANNALSQLECNITANDYCAGDSTLLYADVTGIGSLSASDFMWDINMDGIFDKTGTSVYHTFDQAGVYPVSVLVSYCNGMSDTLTDTVIIGERPQPDLGPDTTICDHTIYTLDAGDAWTYQWSNGMTDSLITVSASGNYRVTVSDIVGCTAIDSVRVNYPNPSFPELGNDTTLCPGETFSYVFPCNSISNWWNEYPMPGAHATAYTSGLYVAKAFNGCETFTDSIYIGFLPQPEPQIPSDTTFCRGEILQIELGPAYFQYHGCSQISGNMLTVTHPGDYIVIMHNDCGSAINHINIAEKICEVEIPNIISPNSDGFNDQMFLVGENQDKWEITIYDRWGRMLYRGNNPRSWNAGKSTPGVYYYVASDGISEKTGFFHIR